MHAVNGLGCNDMVVDSTRGFAYVGSFQELDEMQHPGPFNMARFSDILLVQPDGSARVVAERMTFPNGPVITPDGKTYIVAESFANRLSAFDIEADGSLTNRRVWADIGAPPDGITMDEEGCLWVAVPYYTYPNHGGYIRLREGGEVLDRIDIEDYASYACTLGGPNMTTLFLCMSTLIGRERHQGDGRIMTVEVDVPGVGTP
jgi:sugar lactone lactonase YvrE